MYLTALTMLVGDRTRFLGMVLGLAFASLLITQQAAIFRGVMSLTYGAITDCPEADLWIGDPGIRELGNNDQLNARSLDLVRGVPGIAWVAPLNRRILKLRMQNNGIESVMAVGIDDATFIGGPVVGQMMSGRVEDLRRPRAVVVDAYSARTKLAVTASDGTSRPLAVGDHLTLNGHQLNVVGICRASLDLMLLPTIFMRRSLSVELDFATGRGFNFILAGLSPGAGSATVCSAVAQKTGLKAWTAASLSGLTYDYFLYETGIPANFAIAILLGFVVGVAIAGQAFHQFVADNRQTFAALKAMGVRNRRLAELLLMQALVVAIIGYGLGLGGASLFGILLRDTNLAFRLEPSLLFIALLAVLVISAGSALFSLRLLLRLDPATVFRS